MSRPANAPRPVVGLYVLLAAMLAILTLSLTAPGAYAALVREDGVVEWLTALGLLATASALAARYRERARRRGPAWRGVVLTAAAAALFGFGEEISWGQRIVGYAVAEGSLLDTYNLQGETNVHNLAVGGWKVNKVVFTWGLGLVLLAYFVAYPLATRRRPRLRAYALRRYGVPAPDGESVVVAALAGAVAQAIPLSRSSEAFELVLPVLALVTVLQWRGAGAASARAASDGAERSGPVTRRPAAAGCGSASSA